MLCHCPITSIVCIHSASNSFAVFNTRLVTIRRLSQYLSRNQKQQGFSLFEVLCVLFILTLLAGVAWNSSSGLFRESEYEQANEAQSDLASGLLLARQYAVQAQQSVALCGGVASTLSNLDEECNGDWSSGWFIVQNEELKRQHFFKTDITVSWSGFPQDKSYIQFHANGHTDYQNGTFILCIDGWSSRITLNQSGRFYLGETAPSSEGTALCSASYMHAHKKAGLC